MKWKTIIASTPANAGSYQWNVPNEIILDTRIKITSVEKNAISDINDMDFKTYDAVGNPKDLKIVYPNGGEFFDTVGVFQNITFKNLNNNNVEGVLEFSSDAGQTWVDIKENLYYNGNPFPIVNTLFGAMYTWRIPNINSTQCKIRIKNKSDNSIMDESDDFFTISGATTSSANQLYENNFVKLYPNPCKNNLNIETNDIVDSYCLYSLNGRLIQQNSVNRKKFSIQVDNLGKGTYLLFIKNDKKQFFKKIVKQ
jgi:hypothetical protein